MKPYCSIDIETTGLDRDNHMILEIGAVLDDWVSSVETLPKFRCYVDNGPLIQGSPYALSMHPKIFRYIATNGKEREPDQEGIAIIKVKHVAQEFLTWLQRWNMKPCTRHLTAAGKNFAGFDQQFLRRLPRWEEFIPTQHRVIDPGNLYWDPRIDGNGLPNLKTCMERAGIPGTVAHTALEDAIVVVKLIRIWFKRRGG
jgi:DNA polymerase III epsilon subunit-like protein